MRERILTLQKESLKKDDLISELQSKLAAPKPIPKPISKPSNKKLNPFEDLDLDPLEDSFGRESQKSEKTDSELKALREENGELRGVIGLMREEMEKVARREGGELEVALRVKAAEMEGLKQKLGAVMKQVGEKDEEQARFVEKF